MASMETSLNPNDSSSRLVSGGFDRPAVRVVLAVLGWISLALGIVTLFVPLFPTTVFLLIALWALSQSSSRGYVWLRDHPRLGPSMREWDEHGVLAPRGPRAVDRVAAQRLLDELAIREFTAKTQDDYVRHVATFSEFIKRAPDTATPDDLRAYQAHQRAAGGGRVEFVRPASGSAGHRGAGRSVPRRGKCLPARHRCPAGRRRCAGAVFAAGGFRQGALAQAHHPAQGAAGQIRQGL